MNVAQRPTCPASPPPMLPKARRGAGTKGARASLPSRRCLLEDSNRLDAGMLSLAQHAAAAENASTLRGCPHGRAASRLHTLRMRCLGSTLGPWVQAANRVTRFAALCHCRHTFTGFKEQKCCN